MFIIALIIILILLLIIWDKFGFKDKRRVECAKQFRGPQTLPIVGNFLSFLFKRNEDILPFLKENFVKHGRTMRFWAFNKLLIASVDPKFFQILLSSQHQLTKSNAYVFLQDWLGSGLAFVNGQKWFDQRRITTPAFHFQILQQFVEVFNIQNQIMIEKMKDMKNEKPFDIFHMVTLMSLDIICQTSMGLELHAQQEESAYVTAVKDISYIISERILKYWKRNDFLFSLTKDKARYDECLEILHTFTRDIVEKRRAAIVNDNDDNMPDDEDIGSKKKMALLDILLKSTINERPLTNDEIVYEVGTFIFGGHDTTATATSFTLYFLSQNTELQQKVYEEVMSIVGDDLSIFPTYNQLLEMKYLECCIKESLRICPPLPFIARCLDNDMEFDGKLIPSGVNCQIMIYHCNHDPEYFPNPEEFIPERFYEANENPFLFVPFSAGPRNCIGQKFAMLELKAGICNVIRNFELIKSDIPLQVYIQLTLKSKTGVHVGFKERK